MSEKAPQSAVHLRLGTKEPDRWQSACGLGYNWPSSIALRDEISDDVTCGQCIAAAANRLMDEWKK